MADFLKINVRFDASFLVLSGQVHKNQFQNTYTKYSKYFFRLSTQFIPRCNCPFLWKRLKKRRFPVTTTFSCKQIRSLTLLGIRMNFFNFHRDIFILLGMLHKFNFEASKQESKLDWKYFQPLSASKNCFTDIFNTHYWITLKTPNNI